MVIMINFIIKYFLQCIIQRCIAETLINLHLLIWRTRNQSHSIPRTFHVYTPTLTVCNMCCT